MSIRSNRFKTKRLVLGVSSALILSASYALNAAESEKFKIDVSHSTAGEALLELAEKSGAQIIFSQEIGKRFKTSRVTGEYTLESALNAMLKDSGLRYEFLSEDSVVIKEKNSDTEELKEVEEVVVTGSRIRGAQTSAPVVTITREAIEARGFSSIADVIRSLPQNYNGLNESSHADGSTSSPRFVTGAAAANLRGLGTGSTLVLVNGRRSANAPSEDGTFVDLSKFSIGMVERIEVITGGASAIYGADAVGGVINIITRKDYVGSETSVRYEDTNSNAKAYELRQLFGYSWDSGNATLNLNYKKTDPAERAALGLTSSDHSDRGGRDHRTRSSSSPGTITIRNPALFPGAPADAVLALLPDGDGTNVDFDDLIYITAAERAFQTGNWLLIPPAERFLQEWLTPETINKSINFTIDQQLNDSVELYIDGTYSDRHSTTATSSSTTRQTVPVSNAFNNFGIPVEVNYSLENESRSGRLPFQSSEAWGKSYGLGAGLVADLPWGDWRASLDVRAERTENNDVSYNLTLEDTFNDAALGIPQSVIDLRNNAIYTSNSDDAINYFGNGTGHGANVDFSQFLYSRARGLRESELKSATANFDGSVFEWIGGTAKASIGAEIREESLDYSNYSLNTFATQPVRDLEAVFGELSVPLVGADNALPLINELSIKLAGRYDSYEIVGPFGEETGVGPRGPIRATESRTFSEFSPQIGVIWRPIEDIRVAFDWSEAFQAPTIQELFDPNFAFPSPFFDPIAPGGAGLVFADFGGGGNPELEPQNSESTTVQFQYTPSALPGLNISLAWMRIEFDNVIRPGIGQFASFTDLLTNHHLHPGVQRDLGGNLIGVYFSPINAAFQRTEAVDFDISYDFETDFGEFVIGINGTYTGEFIEQLTPTNPINSTDGTAQGLDTWKVVPSVQWTYDKWSANTFINYSSSYSLNDSDSPQKTVDSLITVDARVQYSFDETMSMALGARNLFDTEAPFHDANLGLSTTRYDIRGRVLYMDFKKSFNF